MIFTSYLCGVKRGFKDRTWFEGVEQNSEREFILFKRGEIHEGWRKLHSGTEKHHNLYASPNKVVVISAKSRLRGVGQVV